MKGKESVSGISSNAPVPIYEMGSEFWKLYRELPEPIRQATKRTYRLWKENPRASALRFKKRFIRFGLERPVIAQSRWMCFSTIGLLKGTLFA